MTATPYLAPFAALLFVSACSERGGSRISSPASPFAVADSLRDQGKFLQAHPLYRALRDSLALTADTANLWRAQVWWAYTLTRTNRTDSAEVALATAIQMVGGDPKREAWTRWVSCSRFSRIGQSDSAIAECTRAGRMAESAADHVLEARVHHQLGTVHSRLGHYRKAVDETERTLAIQRRHGDSPHLLIGTYNSMGIEYVAVGRLSEAEQMYHDGIRMADSLGSIWTLAILKSNLAYLRRSTGDLPGALSLMQESLEGSAQLPDTQSMVYAHNSLAEFYLQAGNRSRARFHLERSVDMNQRVTKIFRVIALVALGQLETADSNLAQAEPILRTALASADTAGFGLQRVNSRAALARLAIKQGKFAAAVRWAEAAVTIADSLDAPEAQIEALEARAEALEASRRSDASDAYLEAIELLDSWRGRLALGDLRMGVAEPRWSVYEGAIRTLLRRGQAAAALTVAERARARLLLEVMASRDASQPAASPLDDVSRRLRVRFEERAAVGGDEERVALDREIARLTDSLTLLEARESGRHPKPASLSRIRAELLGGDRALLSFFWGDQSVYGWWTTRDTTVWARLGAADSLSSLVDFLRATIDRPAGDSSWMAPARAAYQRFIAPLGPVPTKEVLVVADGPLAYIPIEVLVPTSGAQPMGATTRFIYGPSATVLLTLLHGPKARSWERSVLAIANPGGRTGSRTADLRSAAATEAVPGRLRYAGPEARAIGDLFRKEGADVLVGHRATLARWLDHDPGRYRYLHFAAHAQVSDQRPEETYLVLEGGNLGLADIRKLRLSADLVTLSACETALGPRVRGEGIIGLPHAFLAAGARGAVVTLWRIGDRSAADFMGEFYRELHAKTPPADALLAVRRRWVGAGGVRAHPSHWAPFVLVGGMGR